MLQRAEMTECVNWGQNSSCSLEQSQKHVEAYGFPGKVAVNPVSWKKLSTHVPQSMLNLRWVCLGRP